MNIAERKTVTWLFNPFVYIAGGQALALGLAAMGVAGLIALAAQAHFDGVLDLHFQGPRPFASFVAEALIDWLSLTLVLLMLGKLISTTSFRLIDLFGTQALARWPSVLLALLVLPPAFARFTRELTAQALRNPGQIPSAFFTSDAVYFFFAAFVTLPVLAWMIVLMYRAFSVSCNVRGAKAICAFIGGLLIAEILSKIAVFGLYYATR